VVTYDQGVAAKKCNAGKASSVAAIVFDNGVLAVWAISFAQYDSDFSLLSSKGKHVVR